MFNFTIPVPTDAQAAVRSANRLERGQRIIEEGSYTFHFDEVTETVDVIKPGRLAAEYTIYFQPNTVQALLRGGHDRSAQRRGVSSRSTRSAIRGDLTQ